MTRRRAEARRGLSLAELLVALALTGLVTAAALTLVSTQRAALTDGGRRLGALRELRLALQALSADLATAGTELDPGTSALRLAESDSVSYRRVGADGAEETVTWWFEADPDTPRSDDLRLVRRSSAGGPAVVAAGLLRDGDAPLLAYEGVDPRASAPERADIRRVRVRLAAAGPGTPEPAGTPPEARLGRLVDLPNLPPRAVARCGAPPRAPETLDAHVWTEPGGRPVVRVAWPAATDDTGGAGDVVGYVLWRSLDGGPWSDPFRSVPAGRSSYVTVDRTPTPGATVRYAVAARDCGAPSARTLSPPVRIP